MPTLNPVNNYLSEIESEYSRIRGKYSLLNSNDWSLADSWEKQEIPLHIVLRAMSETWRNFESSKRPGTINTLRYFEPEVKKQYAEYLKSQVGKNYDMNIKCTEDITLSDDYADYISLALLTKYDADFLRSFTQVEVSKLLSAAIKKVRSELILLIEDINSKQLSIDPIENRLKAIACEFKISLIADFTDEERNKFINEVKQDYGKFNLTEELTKKCLIRKMYQKYKLPELTLFSF